MTLRFLALIILVAEVASAGDIQCHIQGTYPGSGKVDALITVKEVNDSFQMNLKVNQPATSALDFKNTEYEYYDAQEAKEACRDMGENPSLCAMVEGCEVYSGAGDEWEWARVANFKNAAGDILSSWGLVGLVVDRCQ